MNFGDFVHQLRRHRRECCENLVILSRVGSTNDLARHIANDSLEEGGRVQPTLVVAFEQSRGRGRRDHRWESPAGEGIYATLLCPLVGPAALATLPLLAPVGLCRGLDPHLGDARCRLKWPNDLLVDGRKIGGVLIETLAAGTSAMTALIGFGVNYGQRRVAELPAPCAASVWLTAAEPASLGELAWDLAEALAAELIHLGDARYAVAAYEALSLHQPGDELRCRTGEGEVEGVFRGFDERGFLRLDTGAGELLLSAGEVASR